MRVIVTVLPRNVTVTFRWQVGGVNFFFVVMFWWCAIALARARGELVHVTRAAAAKARRGLAARGPQPPR